MGIRDNLQKLHRLGLGFQKGATSNSAAEEFFDLASELDEQIGDLVGGLADVRVLLSTIGDLYPESLAYGSK